MNKLETLKDIIADKYDGCYEVMRECVKAYANVDTALLDLKDLDLVLMIPIGTWTFLNDKKKELVYASHLDAEAKERIASLMDVVNQKSFLQAQLPENMSIRRKMQRKDAGVCSVRDSVLLQLFVVM